MVLSYTTPKRHRQIIEIDFELDGEKFIARKPKDSIMVYLTAAASESATTADRMYAVMQFVNGCLTPAAQQRIQARLRDYDDDLELDDLAELMKDLSKQFGGGDEPADRRNGNGHRPGAGRVITPDGEEATDITPAANRAERRARPKKAAPVRASARALRDEEPPR